MKFSKVVSVAFITCTVLSAIIFFYYCERYREEKSNIIAQIGRDALHQLSYNKRAFLESKEQVLSVIKLLSHSLSVNQYARDPSDVNRESLQHVWISVANNQKWYSRLCYLDIHGQEKIRVNYLSASHQAVAEPIVGGDKNEAFAAAGKSIAENAIGIWGEGRLPAKGGDSRQLSHSPNLHLVTPVYTDTVRKGYLMINMDVSTLISRLHYSFTPDFQVELVSVSGYYLRADDRPANVSQSDKNGSDFEKFSSRFPDTWQKISSTEQGYSTENGHLLVFTKLEVTDNKQFILLIDIPPEKFHFLLDRDLNELIQEGVFVFLLVLVFALPAFFMSIQFHRRNIESKLAMAALNGMSAVMISDKFHRVMKVNEEFERMTGIEASRIQGQNALKSLLSSNGIESIKEVLEQLNLSQHWEGEVDIFSDSTPITAIMRIQAITNSGQDSYYITSLVDITERKELENKLRELSEKDSLTPLWNRRKFEQELQTQTSLIRRYHDKHRVCLALIDIDHFKRVNDEFGHDRGDEVIIQVGHRLAASLRNSDFVARIGGEEFAVLMPHTHISDAQVVLNRLRAMIQLDSSLKVTISIGLTDLTEDGTRSYKCADIALYESKSRGRNLLSICQSTEDIA